MLTSHQVISCLCDRTLVLPRPTVSKCQYSVVYNCQALNAGDPSSCVSCYETSIFISFSWLLAGNSYMVTLWWCLTYTLIYLLVTRPPLTILTWPLESQWLFTNTCSFLAVTWTVGFPPHHLYLFIVLHDSFLVMHYWSLYCLVDSCTAHCSDSELRLTVHCCALWLIVLVTALLYCSLTVLKSGMLGTCSPRLDFFHHTVISTLVAANRLRSPLSSCLIPLKVIHCNVPKWHAWLTTSHQKLSKSSSWT